MLVRVRLAVYRIDQCGYYERASNDRLFGTIDESFRDLREWRQRATYFGETCPLAKDGPNPKAYCYGVVSRGSDFLVTLWNQLPGGNERVLSIDPYAQGADPPVDEGEVPTGIPGYPTYFWIIPEKDAVVAIATPNRPFGRDALERYMKAFLEKFARFASTQMVRGDDGIDAIEVNGYSANGSEPRRLFPRFKAKLAIDPNTESQIREKRTQIRKVVRRQAIDAVDATKRDFLDRALVWFGVQDAPPWEKSIPLEVSLEYTPEPDELAAIIKAIKKEEEEVETGFYLHGDSKALWLPGKNFRLSAPVETNGKAIISGESLLDQLEGQRASILGNLR